MNVKTDRIHMAGRAVIKVACPKCGWNNDRRLVMVDRYLTDAPPGPRGDGVEFLEIYLDDGFDPDDRVSTCGGCDEDLYPDDATESRPPGHLVELSKLCDMASLGYQLRHRLRIMISRAKQTDADLMSAENWLRMAMPMIEGAQHDLTRYIEKEKINE